MRNLSLLISLLWFVFFGKLLNASNLPDPFILPFGQENGDSFSKVGSCSLAVELERSFRLNNKTIDKVYVCWDGYMMFDSEHWVFPSDGTLGNFQSVSQPLIAPFYADHGIERRFLDSRCEYTLEETTFYASYMYWCRELFSDFFYDRYFHDIYHYYTWRLTSNNEDRLEISKIMQQNDFDREKLKELVREDDEATLEFFGKETTRYPNLVNHAMRRQVTEGEDLEILNRLIRHKKGLPLDSPDVNLNWAYVATWYKKVLKSYEACNTSSGLCFLSFQLVVTCDTRTCFSIFNYHEITNGTLEMMESSFRYQYGYSMDENPIFCGLFSEKAEETKVIPSQCKGFHRELLLTGSNIGVRGIWVYELDQSGQGVISPDDMTLNSTDNTKTANYFNSNDHEEPFLLKFGLEAGDKMVRKGIWWRSFFQKDKLPRRLRLGSFETDALYISGEEGYVSLDGLSPPTWDFYYPRYSNLGNLIAPLFINAESFGSQPNIAYLDYSCLLAGLPGYSGYFDDICFQVASRWLKTETTESPKLTVENLLHLEGNVFKRETVSADDMGRINGLINTKIHDFEATSAYVVSWFRITVYASRENSFQCIIACDEKNNDCVIIMDYLKLEYGQTKPGMGEMGKVWVTLEETGPNLVQSSNYDQAGIWVFYIPGNGSDPVVNFENFTHIDVDTESQHYNGDLFLLPLGPEHGDSFSPFVNLGTSLSPLETCSLPQILDKSLNISGVSVEWVVVCLEGKIELRSFNFTGWWGESWGLLEDWEQNLGNTFLNDQYSDSGFTNFALEINVFENKHISWINGEGILCSLMQEETDVNNIYFQYLDPNYCPNFPEDWEKWNWDSPVSLIGLPNKAALQAVLDYLKNRNADELNDFKSDDEFSKLYFGEDTPADLINLANNMFVRESVDVTDLLAITNFIKSNPKNANFTATWSFVVTWFKVLTGSTQVMSDLSYRNFNSFQMILTCDSTNKTLNDTQCFTIFDYAEVDTPLDALMYTRGWPLGCFKHSENGTYVIPLAVENSTAASNYGYPGRWVFDLNQVNWTAETLGNLTFYEDAPSVRDGDLFLLNFGPKYGDKFLKKSDQSESISFNLKKSELKIEGKLYSSLELDTKGVLYVDHRTCWGEYWYEPWHGYCLSEPVFAIHYLPRIETEDNLLDYMCSENYLSEGEPSRMYYWDIGEFCPILRDRDTSHFGYVYKRETTDSNDLQIITQFVNRQVDSFVASSAYVVSWFKMNQKGYYQEEYNSFQAVIACSDDNDCVIVFDYYELNWGGSTPGISELNKAWIPYGLSRYELTSQSNFGVPGIWVILFPGNGSAPVTDFNHTTDENNSEDTSNSDAYFLLPFGIDHGDSVSPTHQLKGYTASYGICSLPQVLNQPFVISKLQIDWLFVCAHGVIELRSFNFEGSWGESWNENRYNSVGHADNSQYTSAGLKNFAMKVNVFESSSYSAVDHGGLLCSLLGGETDVNNLNFQYLDATTCPYFPDGWKEWDWSHAVGMKGLPDKDAMNAVLEWNINRYRNDVNFRSDDEISKFFLGDEVDPDFLNLANNVFVRQTTDAADLELIDGFINSRHVGMDFKASMSFVVTWYHVNSQPSYYISGRFNSFQLIMACSEVETTDDDRCIAIFDYYNLQTKPNEELGVFDGNRYYSNSKWYDIPVAFDNLTSASNYGFPGRWVFDLSQEVWDTSTLSDVATYINVTTSRGKQPFLLPFGPKHGDSFVKTSNTEEHIRFNLENNEIIFGGVNYSFFTVSTRGKALLHQNEDLDDRYWYGCYDLASHYSHCQRMLMFLIQDLYYIDTIDNLIDYTCTEVYLDEHEADTLYQFDVEEFCPLLPDKKKESEKIPWNHWALRFDNSWQVGYDDEFLTEQQRDAIESWNDMLRVVSKNDVNITSDDNLAKTIFGSDTTKFVNLANNLFKRETTEASDLSALTSFVSQFKPEFEASWAFVATWYKVPAVEIGTLSYNSYQGVITCDVKNDTTPYDDECYVIFDYYEMQWTGSWQTTRSPARCGVKANSTNFLELPTSGTEEVRNLWADSVLGVPGMWLIKLSQEQNDFSIQLVEAEKNCDTSIEPNRVAMHDMDVLFTLHRFLCSASVPADGSFEIKVVFKVGKNEKEMVGFVDGPTGSIICMLEYWGKAEEVDVFVKLNNQLLDSSAKVIFYSPAQLVRTPPMFYFSFLSMSRVHGSIAVNVVMEFDLTKVLEAIEDIFEALNFKCRFSDDQGKAETIVHSQDQKVARFAVTKNLNMTSFTFGVCVLQETSTGRKAYSEPVRGNKDDFSPEKWEKEQKKKDLSKCKDGVNKHYGCPRDSSWNRNDARFARMEVERGVKGWQYDVCCNDQKWESTDFISKAGYGSNCEYNPGAQFCIKSTLYKCKDGTSDDIHSVSNQCCYADETLIEENNLGAGRLHHEESTIGNIVNHYREDLLPFKKLCLEDLGPELCELSQYWSPAIRGLYWARRIRVLRGDPHFTTIDGANYTFNGLNVYTLILTSLSKPTIVQASTRVSGSGTLFSGLAVGYENTVFECFVSKDGTFKVAINNASVELHQLKHFTTSNIAITENTNETSYTFFFMDNDLIIKVMHTGSFLNFFTSVPPTFHSRMKGLLGYYDGNVENDYTAADGTEVSIDSDLMTIHNNFGETWKVERPDWLFQFAEFINEIAADIEAGASYQASYEATFDDESLEQQANEICEGDPQCLFDVSVTGDISFAEAFIKTEAQVKVFKPFNDKYDEDPPDPKIFQDEVDETNDDDLSEPGDKPGLAGTPGNREIGTPSTSPAKDGSKGIPLFLVGGIAALVVAMATAVIGLVVFFKLIKRTSRVEASVE